MATDTPATLHAYLTTLRGDRRQAAIAEAIGVSQSAISSWESADPSARTLPRASRLGAIASAYGADVAVLRDLWHREHEAGGATEAA